MNIELYTYTPTLSSYYKEGRKEYEKRLSRYCKIKHTVLKNQKQLEKKKTALAAALEETKKTLVIWVQSGQTKSNQSSEELAAFIEEQGICGISSLIFLVGFPEEAFPPEWKKHLLSISRMTLSPDLLSLVLEEQIYRAYRIIQKEPYHK
jgi:23S rRNA (pseudouridine1915-N3)-methyltransferase